MLPIMTKSYTMYVGGKIFYCAKTVKSYKCVMELFYPPHWLFMVIGDNFQTP